MDLKEYNEKRNFNETPEPEGRLSVLTDTRRFVIQRHAARRLHYDLRLEINGSLKSWAIPKGPSMNPSDKRLAVRTEDHPIKYLHFHGTIPKGNYGAGEMIIWDSGTFELDSSESELEDLEQLEKGDLKLIFHGKKTQGRFALVRTGRTAPKEHWLIIKKKDIFSTDSFYDAEALIEHSFKSRKRPTKIFPGKILQPMLASQTKEIFNNPKWLYELKWDGYRVLAHISENGVLLQSRNGINYNSKFELLFKELQNIQHETILDGEVVILDEHGVSKFGELQNYPESQGTLKYYVFDMLHLNGIGMVDLPLIDRKSLIPEVVENLRITQYCDHIEGMGTALYDKAIKVGMEGVMAKESKSTYAFGYRSEKWLKIKSVEEMEALICGYTDSEGGSTAFGSLILGIHDKDKLTYLGNCGSGFNDKYRDELLALLQSHEIEKNPFETKISLKGRKPNWVRPMFKCEVKYSEKTKNGLLRNPVFKRLVAQPKQIENRSIGKGKKLSSKSTIDVDGFKVPVSNLEKIYWPESGLMKYDLIDYYLKISETLLPHLIDRPQSLHRHPNGLLDEGFYQKDNEYLPNWIATEIIYSKSSEREIIYLICQNAATLLYMANLGCIEINPWNSKIGSLDRPDYGIIDLDPPGGMDFKNVINIALQFKKLLDFAKIKGYCKLSGSKGIHIFIPMGAQYAYEEVRNFIKLLCVMVASELPEIATLERRITNRNGKVYLDYLQNRRGHTIASVYSVRPLPNAPISAPIYWDELTTKLTAQKFTLQNFQKRFDKVGDLFKKIPSEAIDMISAITKLEDY